MQGDGREETARRARRIAWTVRLVFYPAAIGIAVLLLAARGGDEEPGGVLQGTTSQGAAITFGLDADEAVTSFDTQITATCPSGEQWRVPWWEDKALARSFHRVGSRLEVDASEPRNYTDGQTGLREFTMRAETDHDRTAGEMTFVERLVTSAGERYECASGKVTFTARR